MVKVALRLRKIPKIYKEMKQVETLYVGILGAEASDIHNNSDLTNAQIGAIQEFGSVANNIPARSFLRQPLHNHLGKVIRNWQSRFAKALVNNTVNEFMHKLGEMAVNIIHEAFESGGFGRWAENKPSTLRAKAPETKPLINTRQLRDSITYRISRKGSTWW